MATLFGDVLPNLIRVCSGLVALQHRPQCIAIQITQRHVVGDKKFSTTIFF